MAEQFDFRFQLVFFSTLALLFLLERVRAFQRHSILASSRWTSNVGLFLIGNAVTSLVIPVGIYAFAQHQPPGLMERMGLPAAAQFVVTFLFLDFWRYWEHRLIHQIPLLWRLHLVHHSDTHIDVTSAERHHPLEFVLSTAVLLGLIVVFGLPAPAVGLYLLIATVVVLCSHANLHLPAALERRLSQVFVTPAVHAVHHSELQRQTDSNYGTVLTLWDRLFGSYVNPEHVKIPKFGLGYFHQPKDAGLARVLQQPFLYHRDLGSSSQDRVIIPADPMASDVAKPPAVMLTQGWRNAIWGGVTGSLLALLVLWPTSLGLMSSWRTNEAYQYAWLIIPMLGYVLVGHHQITLKVNPQPDFRGVWVAAAAAVCWGAATLMNIAAGQQLALILMMQGIAMAALGWRAYGQLFPALALLFLMIPSGDLLQPLLRLLTLRSIELFAVLAHLPHTVDGFSISIGTNRYIVVDECSGLSYVTLAMFLGYSFGLLLYRSLVKIVALSLLGAVLGVVSNTLRVNSIVLIDWLRGSQMALTSHSTVQWIALFVTLGLLFYVLIHLKADAPTTLPEISPPKQVRPARQLAPVFAGLAVLLIAGAVMGLTSSPSQLAREHRLGSLPNNLSGWQLATTTERWIVDPQSSNETLTLVYRRKGEEMRVVIVQALSPDAKLQESLLRLDDKNVWRERRVQQPSDCVASGCLTLQHTTWQRDKSPDLRHVFFAYSIDRFTTDSRLALRAANGWYRLTRSPANPRLTGLVFDGAAPDIPEVAAAFRQFQAAWDAGH